MSEEATAAFEEPMVDTKKAKEELEAAIQKTYSLSPENQVKAFEIVRKHLDFLIASMGTGGAPIIPTPLKAVSPMSVVVLCPKCSDPVTVTINLS